MAWDLLLVSFIFVAAVTLLNEMNHDKDEHDKGWRGQLFGQTALSTGKQLITEHVPQSRKQSAPLETLKKAQF